ncbi:GTP 3',8-cyclase MoaA [Bacteroidota bacterium]
MLDRFNRKISYLRISVTDRCNLRCIYCMPEEGVSLKKHEDILTLEEITEVVQTGVKLGISKVRLTGGEPLVRKGIASLIEKLQAVEGIEDLGLTTNGVLLSKMAEDLRSAGLQRLNISLDTLDPLKYRNITKNGNLQDVLDGINEAVRLGFDPIKINFVRLTNVNENDEEEVRRFCKERGLKLRFIQQMNLETGDFSEVEGGTGGVCKICNRLRLTSDGNIVPCLFSNHGYNIREMGIEEAFYKALQMKPESGDRTHAHGFYNIGG